MSIFPKDETTVWAHAEEVGSVALQDASTVNGLRVDVGAHGTADDGTEATSSACHSDSS